MCNILPACCRLSATGVPCACACRLQTRLRGVCIGFGEPEIITQTKGLAFDCSSETSNTPRLLLGGGSHCRVGLMVITDPYNFMLVYNFIAVFAAKCIHAEFQVCFSFPSFFLFFPCILISFLFCINSGACLQSCLGVCMSPH